MLNHAHMSRSRHGIFYFRWPISPVLHPQQRRTDVKLSLGKRLPRIVLLLARWLIGTAVCGIVDCDRDLTHPVSMFFAS